MSRTSRRQRWGSDIGQCVRDKEMNAQSVSHGGSEAGLGVAGSKLKVWLNGGHGAGENNKLNEQTTQNHKGQKL